MQHTRERTPQRRFPHSRTPVARTHSGCLGTTRGQRVPTLLCPAVRKLSGCLKTIWRNSPPFNSPSKRRNGRVGTCCPRVPQPEGSLKTHWHKHPPCGNPYFQAALFRRLFLPHPPVSAAHQCHPNGKPCRQQRPKHQINQHARQAAVGILGNGKQQGNKNITD